MLLKPKSKKRQIIFIIIYVLFIYATLPFMRPVLNYLIENFGKSNLSILVNTVLVSTLLLSIFTLKKTFKFEAYKIGLAVTLFIVGLSIMLVYDRPEERLHFVEYGLLGYMIYFVLLKEISMPSIATIFLVSLIGMGDETIQHFLPNRVGDLRDIFMNSVGGLLGVLVARLRQ